MWLLLQPDSDVIEKYYQSKKKCYFNASERELHTESHRVRYSAALPGGKTVFPALTTP